MRLLVKNLGRGIPESVVREELESLNICVQGVTQLCSGSRDQDPAKDRPPSPTSFVLDIRSENAVTHPGVSRVEVPTSPVVAVPRGNSPSAVAAGETTQRTTGAV